MFLVWRKLKATCGIIRVNELLFLDGSLELTTSQYKKQFKKMEAKFGIEPQKFAQITGLSSEFIASVTTKDTIQINFDDKHETGQYNKFVDSLLFLSTGFADISPRERVRGVIDDLLNVYSLPVEIIAKYCAVSVETLKKFMVDPFNDELSYTTIEKINVYGLFLFKTLASDIE